MRTVLTFLLLLAAPAWALSPEEAAYIAARDRAAAALEHKWDSAAHDKSIGVLTPMLRRIVGPPPKGFPGPGEMVRDTLCCGAGSDRLDAIAFGDAAVTTEGLARHWLGEKPKQPIDLDAKLREGEDLYFGLTGDAAVTVYAFLPIEPPAGTTQAVAHLGLESQAGAFSPPRELGVIVRKGGRVLLYLDKAAAAPELPICEAPLAAALQRATAFRAAGKVDESFALESEASDAYVRCWSLRVREANAYPALTRQAQRIADSLAAD
ncbi:MAG: hypothetical protein KIS73_17020 [Enhydrobacter sp.]|nr:hypothetical protein [Enhydrobacter sp.]